MNTKPFFLFMIFGIAAVAMGSLINPADASAATITRIFGNQNRTTTVFDFGVPSNIPSINVDAEWCWEDGGTTGCFTDSRTLNPGYNGPVFYFSKDDGGNGAPGPNCIFRSGRSDTFDYCMDIMGSAWDGQRLVLDWEGITDRYLNPSMNRSYLTRISVTAEPLAPSGSAPVVRIGVTPTTIQGSSLATISWSSDNANSCTAGGRWSGGRPVSGVETVFVNQTSTFFLTCANNNGERSASATVFVNPAASFVDLNAAPLSVVRGGTTALSWTSSNVSTCTAGGGWSGPRLPSGSETVSLQETAAFTISCQNSRGEVVSDSIVVTVPSGNSNSTIPPLPSVTLSASPTTLQHGGSAILIWNSSNATSCAASGGWSGIRATSGTESVSPTTSTTYSLSCSNAAGSNASSVSLAVVSGTQPSVFLNASPSSIAAGNTTLLTWSTVGATNCTASGGWSGGRSLSGSETAVVSDTINFSLTCRNASGERTETVAVVTNPSTAPIVVLRSSPSAIQRGESASLSWSTVNSIICVASGGWSGVRGTSGSETITPQHTTSYTLTCSNAAGRNTSENITVGVNVAGASTNQAPSIFFTQNPSVIRSGGNSQLSWSTNNATSCTASGGWSGSRNTAGIEVVYPSLSTSYTLTCFGPGGSTSEHRTVSVQSVLGESTGGMLQLTTRARNASFQNTNLSETIEAQGLDLIEIEIRVKNNGTNTLSTVTVRDELPSDLLYATGSTMVNGSRVADSITSNGVVIGSLAPGEEKVIRYQAAVLFGTPVKTLLIRTRVTADSQNALGVVTVYIKPRGAVRGAGTVPTGPTQTLVVTLFAGLIGSIGIYYLFLRYRYPGKNLHAVASNFKFQAMISELKKKEKSPDL